MTLAQLMALIEEETGPAKPPGYGEPAPMSEWADFS